MTITTADSYNWSNNHNHRTPIMDTKRKNLLGKSKKPREGKSQAPPAPKRLRLSNEQLNGTDDDDDGEDSSDGSANPSGFTLNQRRHEENFTKKEPCKRIQRTGPSYEVSRRSWSGQRSQVLSSCINTVNLHHFQQVECVSASPYGLTARFSLPVRAHSTTSALFRLCTPSRRC